MKTYCPHCQIPIFIEQEQAVLSCPSCGKNFHLESDDHRIIREEEKVRRQQKLEAEMEEERRRREKPDPNEEKLRQKQAEWAVGPFYAYECVNCGNQGISIDPIQECNFCHSSLRTQQVSYSQPPRKIIPFAFNEEYAKSLLINWGMAQPMGKKNFKTNLKIHSITPVFIPYWYQDVRVPVHFHGSVYEEKSETVGSGEDKETEYICNADDYYQDLIMTIPGVSVQAVTGPQLHLLNGVEPFLSQYYQDFHPKYTEGCFIQEVDVSREQAERQLSDAIPSIADQTFQDSFNRTRKNYYGRKKILDVYEYDRKLQPSETELVLAPVYKVEASLGNAAESYYINGMKSPAAVHGRIEISTVKLNVFSVLYGLIAAAVGAFVSLIIGRIIAFDLAIPIAVIGGLAVFLFFFFKYRKSVGENYQIFVERPAYNIGQASMDYRRQDRYSILSCRGDARRSNRAMDDYRRFVSRQGGAVRQQWKL